MNKYQLVLILILVLISFMLIFLPQKIKETYANMRAFEVEGTFKGRVSNSPPSFFINLDRDVENRKYMESVVKKYLPTLKRVPGVLHKVGREGCRRAHINAQKAGIRATKPGEYYIVMEDDAKPNVPLTKFSDYIQECQTIGADLILLNVQNRPDLADVKATSNPRFYRAFSGLGSGLSYMVKHEFGKKLIDYWGKFPNTHIDMVWQDLWPDYSVYVHRPLLFLMRPGKSTTGDTLWRDLNDPVCQDFDWDELK